MIDWHELSVPREYHGHSHSSSLVSTSYLYTDETLFSKRCLHSTSRVVGSIKKNKIHLYLIRDISKFAMAIELNPCPIPGKYLPITNELNQKYFGLFLFEYRSITMDDNEESIRLLYRKLEPRRERHPILRWKFGPEDLGITRDQTNADRGLIHLHSKLTLLGEIESANRRRCHKP